jgi:hypothetical protein
MAGHDFVDLNFVALNFLIDGIEMEFLHADCASEFSRATTRNGPRRATKERMEARESANSSTKRLGSTRHARIRNVQK